VNIPNPEPSLVEKLLYGGGLRVAEVLALRREITSPLDDL